MPYGLPGAIKITRPQLVQRWDDQGPDVFLKAGELLQPLYPGADQDGRGDEWCCRTLDGVEVAIPTHELTPHL
jgi:hypothetical protein